MKVIKITVALAVGLYCASLVYVLSFSWKPSLPKHADGALILGAKVNLNNSPSDPLFNRTEEAVALYQQHRVDYVLTTGGIGLGPTAEGKIGAKIAEKGGVPANRVISEQVSHNTFENVEDIKAAAQNKKVKSLIVVSDRFHVARGVLVAKHFGFGPVYWDFPDEKYYPIGLLVQNYAREALAMFYYVPKVLLTKN